jgi:integrase
MTLEEARARAREIISLVQDQKRDPRQEERAALDAQQQNGRTFAQLFADWLEGYAMPNLRAWDQARDKLKKHALPYLGDMPPAAIKPAHINNILDRLVTARKGTQANRVRAHLSAVFKWGLSRNYGLEYNPVQMTMRPKRREYPRSVVYDHADMLRLWTAISDGTVGFSEEVGLAIKLALATGQRARTG